MGFSTVVSVSVAQAVSRWRSCCLTEEYAMTFTRTAVIGSTNHIHPIPAARLFRFMMLLAYLLIFLSYWHNSQNPAFIDEQIPRILNIRLSLRGSDSKSLV